MTDLTQSSRRSGAGSRVARAPRRPGGRLFTGPGLLALVLVGVLAYLVLLPIVVLAISSLRPSGFLFDSGFTLSNYVDVYTNPRTWRMLGQTLIFAVGGTTIALVLGTTFAWLVERASVPGARVFRLLLILPMFMPPLLLAISWVLLLSPTIGTLNTAVADLLGHDGLTFNIYSMPGMIFVQGLAFTPTAFLLMSPAMRNMDPSLEEAAAVSGKSLIHSIRTVTLPLMMPNILATTIFLFIISLLVFDVPGLIGIRGGIFVLSSEIYYQLSGGTGAPDHGAIGAIAVLPLLLLLPLTYGYQRLISRGHRFVTVTSRGYRPSLVHLGAWKWVGAGAMTFYFVAAVLLPLAVLVATSFVPYLTPITPEVLSSSLTLDNYRSVFADRQIGRAVVNTVQVGLVVATGLALFAAIVSWVVVRSRARLASTVDRLAFLPVSLSNTMIGVALVYVYLNLPLLDVYGTIWIIAIAHFTAYLTFSTRTINGAMLQIHPDLEAAARVSGANAARAFRRVTIPLLRPAIAVVWIWIVAHSMRELSAALILTGRGNPMVSTSLWSYWEGGRAPVAASLGVLLILVLSALALVWDRLGGRRKGEK